MNKINKLNNFTILNNPEFSQSNNWLNLLKLKKNNYRYLEKVLNIFFQNKIQVRPVWYPNHLQKKMKKFQRYKLSEYKNYYNSIICLQSGYDLEKKI